MAEFNKVLYAIDTGISPQEFERLCLDMLSREGYRHIVPGGRGHDLGRDAELRFWSGGSAHFSHVIFQFSLEERWEGKLKNDTKKIAKNCPGVSALVFVTSRNVTVAKLEKLRAHFRSSRGWDLTIYDREWLRLRLEQRDQDLAKKYFGLDLPASITHVTALVQLTDFDGDEFQKLFAHDSPESVRAALIESTRKEPNHADHWKQLARLEYYLHNFDEALKAVNRCLELEKSDKVAQINLRLFKGAILAESGVSKGSRPILIEAKDILSWSVNHLKRTVDYYNYANVLSALGESEEAEKCYRICLASEPTNPHFLTNLANLLLTLNRVKEAMDCFDEALQINPNLAEAHLSRARACILYLKNPEEAIASYEAALRLMPEVDQRGRYIRYQYAQSLAAAGRFEDALREVDAELAQKPGDKYLLTLKRDILAKLWRIDARHEPVALEFARFRVRAVKHDYNALCDLIHLCVKRELHGEAWTAMQTNIDYGGFSVRDIASKAGISLTDFANAFANVRLYAEYRRHHPLERHFVELAGHGLTQNSGALACLDQVLLVPFANLAQKVRAFSHGDKSINLNTAFKASTESVSRLIAIFGPNWLAKEPPSNQQDKIDLLALGMLLGFDILVAEMARQFGFLGGCFGLTKEDMVIPEKCSWKTIQTEFAVDLMKDVMAEWKMFKAGEGSEAEK